MIKATLLFLSTFPFLCYAMETEIFVDNNTSVPVYILGGGRCNPYKGKGKKILTRIRMPTSCKKLTIMDDETNNVILGNKSGTIEVYFDKSNTLCAHYVEEDNSHD